MERLTYDLYLNEQPKCSYATLRDKKQLRLLSKPFYSDIGKTTVGEMICPPAEI